MSDSNRDLVWLEIYMPEATSSEKQQFLNSVSNLIRNGGLSEMHARRRALDEILKERKGTNQS